MFENRLTLSTSEAGEAVGVTDSRIRQLILEKRLKAHKPKGQRNYYIFVDDLKNWVRSAGAESPATNSKAG